MKKFMEYCEIVCPPRSNAIDPHSFSVLPESERPYVVLGSDERGALMFLLNGEKKMRRFLSALDAVNFLSKNDGWHLAKIYTGGADTRAHGYEFWVMAREVRIED